MVFSSQLFRKVTIVGVGLIGGSIGLAIKKHNLAREIVGVSRKNSSLVYALKNKTIDKAYHDIPQAVRGSDLVILATPVSTIESLLTKLGPHLKRNCIITDVGSTKSTVVETAHKYLPPTAYFIGSHPLAGSEKKGAVFASDNLFNNSLCIITPTEKTNRLARDKIKQFWTKLGAEVKVMAPDEHDKTLAYISHLPHLIAYGMMDTVPAEFLPFATQGLKDTTRIASSSPQVWNDICMANAKHILKSLDEFVKNISLIRKAIIARRENELIEQFQRSKKKRDNLNKDE